MIHTTKMIRRNNIERWYKGDKLHREDGPAITWTETGKCSWYLEGLLHRDNGPAMTAHDGSEYWFQYGRHHREDGPASIDLDGSIEWYLKGIKINSAKEFQLQTGKSDEDMLALVLKFGEIK